MSTAPSIIAELLELDPSLEPHRAELEAAVTVLQAQRSTEGMTPEFYSKLLAQLKGEQAIQHTPAPAAQWLRQALWALTGVCAGALALVLYVRPLSPFAPVTPLEQATELVATDSEQPQLADDALVPTVVQKPERELTTSLAPALTRSSVPAPGVASEVPSVEQRSVDDQGRTKASPQMAMGYANESPENLGTMAMMAPTAQPASSAASSVAWPVFSSADCHCSLVYPATAQLVERNAKGATETFFQLTPGSKAGPGVVYSMTAAIDSFGAAITSSRQESLGGVVATVVTVSASTGSIQEWYVFVPAQPGYVRMHALAATKADVRILERMIASVRLR